MPTIIENTQQVNALNEIEAALAIITSSKTLMSAREGPLAILYQPEQGRKVQVDVPAASRAKAIGILSTTKDRLVKDVKSKAAKFHISLDDADLACMGDIQQNVPSDEGEPQNSQSDTTEEQVGNAPPSEAGPIEEDMGDEESLI